MTDGMINDLISLYHDLNGASVDELREPPSALEFMKYVAKNRPFIVRQGMSHSPALHKWNCEYLKRVLGPAPVKVAITPNGKADSVTRNPVDDKLYFVKPLEEQEAFEDFLDYVVSQQKRRDGAENVKYAQTQNDNLREEYAELYQDVEQDISWARIALDREPEAINLWIGNSHSTTALHRDNYENIYCQITGKKRFILLPPVETACINEQMLPSAIYVRRESDTEKLVISPDNKEDRIPFAIWDPDNPGEHATQFSHLSRPSRVELEPGDMLYLPTQWYHKVTQICGEEGICCAVNYWYDMDFDGIFYSATSLIRNMALSAAEPHGQNS
ncbi:hypothetical protein MMC14_009117 [Varicellaria rhodocarpa]|nr:hypothetical protein [Varicellaria rhodocarpa]